MKKFMFVLLLFVAGCYSSTYIPFTDQDFPAHKTTAFVKDTTSIPFYYFFLGEYLINAHTPLATRTDLMNEIIEKGNNLGADLITNLEFDTEKYFRQDHNKGFYTSENNFSKCLFIRFLRDSTGKPIERIK